MMEAMFLIVIEESWGGGGTENRMNSIMIGWSQRYWCELIFFYRGRYK